MRLPARRFRTEHPLADPLETPAPDVRPDDVASRCAGRPEPPHRPPARAAAPSAAVVAAALSAVAPAQAAPAVDPLATSAPQDTPTGDPASTASTPLDPLWDLTLAPVADPPQTARRSSPDPSAQTASRVVEGTVTVRQGETLWALTEQLLPDASPEQVAAAWPRLWEANAALVPDPEVLRPGQVLTVPPDLPTA